MISDIIESSKEPTAMLNRQIVPACAVALLSAANATALEGTGRANWL